MSGKKTRPESTISRKPSRPLVFISHDHRDATLAEAFSNLLTDASGGFLESFRSSDRKGNAGIAFGLEWFSEIMSKIDAATDVVALLTSNSVDRPWILYEVGVAKGKLNKQVFGVVIGIPFERGVRGPFAQLQNSADDEDSLTKLVLDLIRRNSYAEPRPEAVRHHVSVFRASMDRVRSTPNPEKVKERNAIDEIILALAECAQRKVGALIVLERNVELPMFIESGVSLDALISRDLLLCIFTAHNELHDGAVIIRRDRIAAASCFLPLSLNTQMKRRLGARHRAAVGISEEADCLSLVVSEETGVISVVAFGELLHEVSTTDVAERISRHFGSTSIVPTTTS